MKFIAVYCGSSYGDDPVFEKVAFNLGKTLGKARIGLIYGGAKVGLMGSVANGALTEHGEVIGIIPTFLKTKEVAHNGLSQLLEVDSMHERKTRMYDLADGIIALPGGFGTLEELFEMITWAQLGLHQKPIGILNIDGFYDALIQQLNKMYQHKFIKEEHLKLIIISQEIEELLEKMKTHTPIIIKKWISRKET